MAHPFEAGLNLGASGARANLSNTNPLSVPTGRMDNVISKAYNNFVLGGSGSSAQIRGVLLGDSLMKGAWGWVEPHIRDRYGVAGFGGQANNGVNCRIILQNGAARFPAAGNYDYTISSPFGAVIRLSAATHRVIFGHGAGYLTDSDNPHPYVAPLGGTTIAAVANYGAFPPILGCDKITIWYRTQSGGGTFSVGTFDGADWFSPTVTAVTSSNTSTSGSEGFARAEFTLGTPRDIVGVACDYVSGGNCDIIAITAESTTNPGVLIFDSAVSGQKATQQITPIPAWIDIVTQINPDFVFFETKNDVFGSTGTGPLSTSWAATKLLFTNAGLSPDWMICANPWESGESYSTSKTRKDFMRSIASDLGGVYLDPNIYAFAGSPSMNGYTAANGSGLMRDTVHPTRNYWGQFSAEVLGYFGVPVAQQMAIYSVLRDTQIVGTLAVSGNETLSGALIDVPQALSGSGAVNLTTLTTEVTTTGSAAALTLANGTNGQIKIIQMVVDGGGDATLTPTTKTGFTTITFNDATDTVILRYRTTLGWIIVSNSGCTVA